MRKNRAQDELRPIEIQTNYTKHAAGSVLVSFGDTKVLCTASIEDKIPRFLKESPNPTGWITAEYNMLPGSTHTRSPRERQRIGGRTLEIQRLIGRSLRSVTNLKELGQKTITIDCDVLQADGGTRTTSINGAFIALLMALSSLKKNDQINTIPLTGKVAAISVGKVNNSYLLDLDYSEDHIAEIDMNIVMTDTNEFVEIQGSGEKNPFSSADLENLLNLAKKGIKDIFSKEKNFFV